MEPNDYIGNMSNSRWQSMNASYLNRTPSWMQGGFKQGTMPQQNRYQAPNTRTQQRWQGGDFINPNTRSVAGKVAGAFENLAGGLKQAHEDKLAAASAPPAPAPAPVLPTAPLPAPSPTATPYTPRVRPTLPTSPLAPPSPTATPFTPTTPSPLPSSPLPPPAPGVTPFGAPSSTPAFPAPGTPAPARQPLNPQQQNAVAGVAQNKAQPISTTPFGQPSNPLPPMNRSQPVMATNPPPRTTSTPASTVLTPTQQQAVAGVSQNKAQPTSTALAGQPSNPLPPMQRPPSVMATNRPPRTPANKPARTRAQKRGIADAAFASIRQSLNNQKP